MFNYRWPMAIIVLWNAMPALAGPLQQDWLPQKTAWVVHVDIEAALTPPLDKLIGHPLFDPLGLAAYVEELAEMFDIDLRRVGCTADAEDLTQETFLKAWRSLRRYDTGRRFSTWLFCIANRLAIDLHRTRGSRPRIAVEADLAMAVDGKVGPEQIALAQEQQRTIWDMVAAVLTPEQQAALWLRYAEDASNQEIADVLGKTDGGVRMLLMRARITLAEHLLLLDKEAAFGDGIGANAADPACRGGV